MPPVKPKNNQLEEWLDLVEGIRHTVRAKPQVLKPDSCIFHQVVDSVVSNVWHAGLVGKKTTNNRLFVGGYSPHAQDQGVMRGFFEDGSRAEFSVVRRTDVQSENIADIDLSCVKAGSVELLSGKRLENHPNELVRDLKSKSGNQLAKLICEVEFVHFVESQRDELLPLLFDFIVANRNSSNYEVLVGVNSAIRKYLANIPMGEIDKVAVLLQPQNNSPLKVGQLIEVAKMVFKNFEVYPPSSLDTHSDISERLWKIAQDCMGEYVFSQDKFSTAASLAVEALVATRSSLSEQALGIAKANPHEWFFEIIISNLNSLQQSWAERDINSANWLEDLLSNCV